MTTTRQRRGAAHERATAAAFGAERIAGVGRRDVSGAGLSIECKSSQKLPKWLTGAMEQAERLARPGTLALVVLHELGDRHDDDLVMLRRRDFIAWWGEKEEEHENDEEELAHYCPICGQPWKIVRPGKYQPACTCQEDK